jgi:hypothetical protein
MLRSKHGHCERRAGNAREREAIPGQRSANDKKGTQGDGTQQEHGSRLRAIATRIRLGCAHFVARGLLRNTRAL